MANVCLYFQNKFWRGRDRVHLYIYNHDENYMFKKTYTVDTFEELIAYTDKIFKLDTNTIDSISDEMVKTFKNSFDRLLK